MSAFKLVEVVKTAEKETQSFYDKDTLDAAIISMHNDFGVAVKQDTTLGVYCTIIDNTLGINAGTLHWGEEIRNRVYSYSNTADANIVAYDSEQLAIGNYHTKLASQRSNVNNTLAVTVRLDGEGKFADYDIFVRSTPEGE